MKVLRVDVQVAASVAEVDSLEGGVPIGPIFGNTLCSYYVAGELGQAMEPPIGFGPRPMADPLIEQLKYVLAEKIGEFVKKMTS